MILDKTALFIFFHLVFMLLPEYHIWVEKRAYLHVSKITKHRHIIHSKNTSRYDMSDKLIWSLGNSLVSKIPCAIYKEIVPAGYWKPQRALQETLGKNRETKWTPRENRYSKIGSLLHQPLWMILPIWETVDFRGFGNQKLYGIFLKSLFLHWKLQHF